MQIRINFLVFATLMIFPETNFRTVPEKKLSLSFHQTHFDYTHYTFSHTNKYIKLVYTANRSEVTFILPVNRQMFKNT